MRNARGEPHTKIKKIQENKDWLILLSSCPQLLVRNDVEAS